MNVSHTVLEQWKADFKLMKLTVQSALKNEQLTRARVENCEKALTETMGLLSRDFWGRLRWLMRGK